MTETPEKKDRKEITDENVIVAIFKKLLEINFFTYGGKKDVLK